MDKLKIQCILKMLLFFASFVLIFYFIKIVSLLYYLPIYPDEIAIRLWMSRIIIDFPNHVNIMPSGANFLIPMPIIWYLPGLLEWGLHGLIDNLHTLRLVGIFLYLLIVFLATYFLINKSKNYSAFSQLIAFGLVLSLLGMGLLPVFFVTTRPEQVILVCLLILFIIDERNENNFKNKRFSVLMTITFFVVVSLMLYVHPKSFYFTPVFFLMLYRFFLPLPKKKSFTFLMITLFILLIVLIAENLHAWHQELNYSPIIKKYMESFNIKIITLISNPTQFFSALKISALNEKKLLIRLIFQKHPEINYLPSVLKTQHEIIINRIIEFNSVFLLFVSVIFLIYCYCGDVFKKNYLSNNFFLLLVFFSIIAENLLNLTKTWYDVGYFWSVVLLVTISCIGKRLDFFIKTRAGILIALYFTASTIFSFMFFYNAYGHQIFKGFAGPSVPLIHFNYKKYKSENELVAQRCLLNSDPKKNHGLVLDDYTYLYFKNSVNPMLVTYVNNHTNKNEFPRLIQENKITAIIARCTNMPLVKGADNKYMLKIKQVCCYPENKIHKLFDSTKS